MQALVQTFRAEADENLGRMEETLVALESSPGNQEMLRTIFRVAHTLKGNGAALGFTGLTEFAHRVEDCLDGLLNGTAACTSGVITALLRCVDAKRELISLSLAGDVEMKQPHRQLLEHLAEEASLAPVAGGKNPAPTTTDHRNFPGRRQEDLQLRSEQARTLRVGIEKLDRLLNLTGEIVIARGHLKQVLEEAQGRSASALEISCQADNLYLELQELVLKVRMVPVGPTFRQYVRTVRDLAAARGKAARLVLEGEDVEVDMSVIEQIRDPLTHMIRNAVGHGIELPDERRAVGKDPTGQIILRAFHDTGSIVIQVTDDGAGLNRARIAERTRTRGLGIDPDKLSDPELYRLIFEPGFSTAETVTEVSGRGIGMDVVRRNVEALRGSVSVESAEGRGATITLRLPLTLAIISGLCVGVGNDTYVVPLDSVVECLAMPEEERRNSRDRGYINLRGNALPYIRLRSVFGIGGEVGRSAGGAAASSREQVVVVQHGTGTAGLAVDALYGESQAIIKPLGKLFEGLHGISGSTIRGNGRVALILDLPSLLNDVVNQESMVSA
jgi:two-component system, chemotaxis family, sensor kinase CheA